MKLGLSLPKSLLPDFLRADKKAIAKLTTELETLKKQSSSVKNPKRVSLNLSQRRSYMATMQQDELKAAVLIARDPLRPRRSMLLAMYDEVWENDGHLIGESRKAILKVVGSPFGLFKLGTQEIDEQATRLFQKKWFEDYRKYFQEANFFGHSLVQFAEWVKSEEKGMEWEVKRVELIPREHVRPEEGLFVLDVSDEVGIPFREEKFKKGLMLIEMGDSKYLGLLCVATKEFIWKNYSRSDWSRHSEKFGMPMVAIKAATDDKTELDKLEQMARNFGENLWMILDPEDEIELKEPTFKDSYNIYKELAAFANSEISKAISGATGTSDEKSFVGAAKVHEDILNEFVEANKRAETYHINEELLPFLRENGYPIEGLEFRYMSYQDNEDPENDDAESTDGKNANPKKKGQGGGLIKKSQQARYRYRF